MIRRASNSWVRACVCAAGLVLLPACETITEKITEKAMEAAVESAIEKQTGGEVDINTGDNGVTFKSKDGKGGDLLIQSQTGKIPDSWPKDIPAYPGAKVNASVMSGKNGMLMLETTDASDKVLAFYKAQMSAMKETASINAGGTTMLTLAEEQGKRQLAIGASVQDGKTMIHLQFSEKGN